MGDATVMFLSYLEAQNMSLSTRRQAEGVLAHLYRAVGDIPVSLIEPRHVDAMFAAGAKWQQGTRNNYLQHLNNFFRWCRVQRYQPYDYNPAAHWRTRKVLKPNKTWLTLPVLEALVLGASPRDRAFLAVGMFTFLRASEIVTLRLKDIDFQNEELEVMRHKTKQGDILPICTELKEELILWLTTYRDWMGQPLEPEWLLIPSKGPQPMKGVPGKRTFVPDPNNHPKLKPNVQITNPHLIIRRNMERIGIEVKKGDGSHILRRSGARNLFEELRAQGHDGAARRTQAMLGHSSVLITEGYLGIDYEKRKRNAEIKGRPMFSATAPQTPAIEAPVAKEIEGPASSQP